MQARGMRSVFGNGSSRRRCWLGALALAMVLPAAGRASVPSRRPLSFIANAGQTDSRVLFHVQGAGHTIFFTPDEVVFSTIQEGEERALRSAVALRFSGANRTPRIEPLEPLPGIANFFLGRDPAGWRTRVPTYAAVAYRDLYPGIDLVYRGTEGRLKSEFLVAPGAQPEAIRLAYAGMKELRLRDDGALVIETALGELIEEAPFVYQEIAEQRIAVAAGYRLLGAGGVGLTLGAYDPARPLVIDPGFVYVSFLGGSGGGFGGDRGVRLAVDASGAAYAAGHTSSLDFPATLGSFQINKTAAIRAAYVAKIEPGGGAIVYANYLAGISDHLTADVAIPSGCISNCEVVVVGTTNSFNFPVKNAFQPNFAGSPPGGGDYFISRFTANGSGLVYSTYLGSSSGDSASGVAMDAAGNAYVTGITTPGGLFPTTEGAYSRTPFGGNDSTVTVFSPAGDHLYGSYVGGDGRDQALGIAVDANGHVYLTGFTASAQLPTTNGAFQGAPADGTDAFVMKLNPSSGGTSPDASDLLYLTYVGGSSIETGRDIAVDGTGRIYVAGTTFAADFPTRPNPGALMPAPPNPAAPVDGFVLQLNPGGTGAADLLYSTFLGGIGDDDAFGIAVDEAGTTITVTGRTRSADFPTSPGAAQIAPSLLDDAFVAQLRPGGAGSGDLLYSTFLAGAAFDFGQGVALDPAGDIYVTGFTASPDFPVTAGAFDVIHGGDEDAFVAKLSPSGPQGVLVGTGTGTMTATIDRIPPCGSSLELGEHFGHFRITIFDTQGNVLFEVTAAAHDLPPCPSIADAAAAPAAGSTPPVPVEPGPSGAIPLQELDFPTGPHRSAATAVPLTAASTFPAAGVDVLQNTTAEVTVRIGSIESTAHLKGSVVIARSDPNPQTRAVTIEMQRLLLAGYSDLGLPIRIRAGRELGLPVSPGTIIPADPEAGDFPATTTFDLTFEVTLPRVLCQEPTVTAAPGQCAAEVPCSAIAACLEPGGIPPAPSCDAASPYSAGGNAVRVTCGSGVKAAESICHVHVLEQGAPAITCPPATTLPADLFCQATYSGPLATATDACDPRPIIGSNPRLPATFFGAGPHILEWHARDRSGNTASCNQVVTVADTMPPEVFCAVQNPQLWPPNHGLVDIGLLSFVRDNCDPDPAVARRVTSDENPETQAGSGGQSHCPDAFVGDGCVQVRAERAGNGDGRVYAVEVMATDSAGNTGICRTPVGVQHDRSGAEAVDSGQIFDATVCPTAGPSPAGGEPPVCAEPQR